MWESDIKMVSFQNILYIREGVPSLPKVWESKKSQQGVPCLHIIWMAKSLYMKFEWLKLPSSDSKHILYVERWFPYKEKNSSMFCDALKVIWKLVGVRYFWNTLLAYWELGEQFTKQWKMGTNYCCKLHC